MSDILTEICEVKRAHIASRKAEHSLASLEDKIKQASPVRGFTDALMSRKRDGHYGLIAEIKKASPSRGLIRADFDPPALAKAYQSGGATCLSVLTDAPYFQGHDSYLRIARNAVNLPALRKDFMLDPWQITESRALGADCILLILAALSDAEAAELEAAAGHYGMDVLLEIHNAAELDRALRLKSPLIGINNRNLKTLEVDSKTALDLAPLVPDDRHVIAESGLLVRADLDRLAALCVTSFLIGESLMRHDDVEQATRALIEDR